MKPIIFSTPMVEALLNTKADVWPPEPIDDTKPFKWQTRRVIKPQPPENVDRLIIDGGYIRDIWRGPYRVENGELWKQKTLGRVPWKVGEHLWVREMWHTSSVGDAFGQDVVQIEYATGRDMFFDITHKQAVYFACKARWRPSISMPRDIARLFLEVKDVRVERLQDITLGKDAEAEGVPKDPYGSYRESFRQLWDELNAKGGYPWNSNPYVWVIEFGRVSNKEAKNEADGGTKK